MRKILISPTGDVAGYCDPSYEPANGYTAHDLPAGFDDADFGLLIFADGVVKVDAAAKLAQAKAARVVQIKAEAAEYIEATDWRLQRAKEREAAGWATLADVDAVLAQREAVRRSSDAAEAAVAACTTLQELAALTWTAADVAVPVPRLLTHEQLIKLFTPEEWEAMTQAARTSAAMDAWMRRFSLASVVNFDDEATVMGIQMLEMAGILAAGRAAEILASVP